MKIVTVIGARPQFVKCAALSHELRREFEETLVHTGQHYDDNMSATFFRELNIPEPNNLRIGSGSHGSQTGHMLLKIEEILQTHHPDLVMLYGDSNSTLAGAIAAAKLNLPIAHVEAGLRSYNRPMPEEINRILTDHVSSFLFCPTETAVRNLRKEGITTGVIKVGDVMYDALCHGLTRAKQRTGLLETLGLRQGGYFLATVHRAENTDDIQKLERLLKAFAQLAETAHRVVFPVHPRTRMRIEQMPFARSAGVLLLEPVSLSGHAEPGAACTCGSDRLRRRTKGGVLAPRAVYHAPRGNGVDRNIGGRMECPRWNRPGPHSEGPRFVRAPRRRRRTVAAPMQFGA